MNREQMIIERVASGQHAVLDRTVRQASREAKAALGEVGLCTTIVALLPSVRREMERQSALRRQRAEVRRVEAPLCRPLMDRLEHDMLRIGWRVIEGWGVGWGNHSDRVIDRCGSIWLMGREWREEYSKQYMSSHPPTYKRRHFLVWVDRGRPVAVKVAGTCTTVQQAIAWTMPAEVVLGREDGHVLVATGIRRYGHVLLVPRRRGGTEIDERSIHPHEVQVRPDGSVVLTHPLLPPATVSLPAGHRGWKLSLLKSM